MTPSDPLREQVAAASRELAAAGLVRATNGNVSEILPGCVPPLTYSLFSRGVERGFRSVAETIGSMPGVGPHPIVVGFFFHRLYLNVSYFMTAADNSPGATRDTVYEDLIGPSQEKHPAWRTADLLPWRLWRGLGIIGRFLAMQGRLDKDLEACRVLYVNTRHRFDDSDPSQWPMADLLRWIEVDDDDSLLPVLVHLRASQFATSSFATLRSLTRRWLDDAGGAAASSLVTGIGSIAGANPAFGLYELARLVADDPALRKLFRDEPDDRRLLEYLETAGDGSSLRFLEHVRTFIEQHGHRGFREADFRSPTWRERPASVIAHLRANLGEPGGLSPQAIAERQEKSSADARARAFARLPAWKRVVFASILDAARKHIAAREEMKDVLLKFLELRRRVLVVARTRLAAVLDDPDDMYFLLDGEIASALRGELARAVVANIVRRRRRDFEWCARIDVPKVQDGVARWVPRSPATPDAGMGPGDLPGLPVSPGVAEGRARVVLDPTGAVLATGEILVAPVTDVAWTPLFLRAAGLVVEVGGPLSHGSSPRIQGPNPKCNRHARRSSCAHRERNSRRQLPEIAGRGSVVNRWWGSTPRSHNRSRGCTRRGWSLNMRFQRQLWRRASIGVRCLGHRGRRVEECDSSSSSSFPW